MLTKTDIYSLKLKPVCKLYQLVWPEVTPATISDSQDTLLRKDKILRLQFVLLMSLQTDPEYNTFIVSPTLTSFVGLIKVFKD